MEAASTPMLKQYQEIKSQYRDCILFYRLGDFYEMFYEDAQTASSALDLVLTSRGKGTSCPVPMCGIPFHAAKGYIAKLIKAGHKVAICEQLEDPSAAKGIVKRDVIRVITSGTFLDDTSTDARYLICINPLGKQIGLAFTDPAAGTIFTNQYDNPAQIMELICRLSVYECIYPSSREDNVKSLFHHPLLKTKNITMSPYEDWCFNPDIAKRNLCAHFGLHNLHGFGIENLTAAAAGTGALLEYLRQMNKQPLRHIDKISLYTDQEFAFISPAATYGLELETLFKTINHTLTSLGQRKLRDWLYHPLKQPAAICQRQAAVHCLKEAQDIRHKLAELLRPIPDIEKCVSRLSCGYLQPRDILAIRNCLALLPEIQQTLSPLAAKNRLFAIEDLPELRALLERAVNPDIPLAKAEGKVIRQGYHSELDELRDIQDNGRQWLRTFQEREIQRTRIQSLKVGFNKIFGYYIEISKPNIKLVPQDYIRKQTLVNGERFLTPELKEFEEKILTAEEKILKIETVILQQLQKSILDHSLDLHTFCQSIATVDVLYSLTVLALSPQYIAPHIAEDSLIDIKDGRHPVVDKTTREPFVPNDTHLDCQGQHMIILTGPNMAGKSTYIRQIALLVIMAQIGSYIPAACAHIGIVDKIFTRIGAHDDITKGQSTFMVEMNETADILNNLTDRSLIILDEVGRGTSTYDGLSLAWALAEHLQTLKTRTLFATHFHEITALAEEHSGVTNYNVAVKEWKDEIIFLHKIVPGSTDDSYGIYVAKLAGVPAAIIQRARTILTELELKKDLRQKLRRQAQPRDPNAPSPSQDPQLSFFERPDTQLEKLQKTLADIDINRLTPLEAINQLQKLKTLLEDPANS
jgi:DNA mismatch repair protein MutS